VFSRFPTFPKIPLGGLAERKALKLTWPIIQKVINYVTNKASRFFRARPARRTNHSPNPNLAAYCDFSHATCRKEDLRWQDVSPLIVGEILSGDLNKDLVRKRCACTWHVADHSRSTG